MKSSNKREYAIVANTQEELEGFLGVRGILSGASGIEDKMSLEGPLQVQNGYFKIYGELEQDAFGRKRSGESITEAIDYVKNNPNSVLCITSIAQISNNITEIAETLESIHEANSGISIRRSSRALEMRFENTGEHNGWIWIGDTLADFIEQVQIAADFDSMFNPNLQ